MATQLTCTSIFKWHKFVDVIDLNDAESTSGEEVMFNVARINDAEVNK
jgi:hypothetical protein